ncbi:MAG: hypothetical protein M3Z04_07195 [Chloroflexota bacterium]|nr:hypothetical protein [Chloroflexota bacterium]
MAVIILPDNGQRIPLDDATAADDTQVKAVLRVAYPELGDAVIQREVRDGILTVTVIKQAGRKG